MKILTAVLLLLCAGCGKPAREEPVHIAIGANSLSNIPTLLAERLGFFRQQGVEVVIESLPSTSKTVEDLLAGAPTWPVPATAVSCNWRRQVRWYDPSSSSASGTRGPSPRRRSGRVFVR